MLCQFCNKICKNANSLSNHVIRCPENPNRKLVSQKWTEEQKLRWSQKCLVSKCNNKEWDESRRKKRSISSKKHNEVYWTTDVRQKHSELMKQIVLNNPDSYTKNNVSGRVKVYEVDSSLGPTKVKGQWELNVVKWLNDHKIKWTNTINPYNYFWNNKWHLYFPDILLIEQDILIEIKGYETERDIEKWKSVTDKKFVVLKKEHLSNITQTMKSLGICC